jgi:hypothetical protein
MIQMSFDFVGDGTTGIGTPEEFAGVLNQAEEPAYLLTPWQTSTQQMSIHEREVDLPVGGIGSSR